MDPCWIRCFPDLEGDLCGLQGVDLLDPVLLPRPWVCCVGLVLEKPEGHRSGEGTRNTKLPVCRALIRRDGGTGAYSN